MNRTRPKEVTIQKDGLTLKGYQNKDSSWVDTLEYYDKFNHLIGQELYRDGKLNGIAFEFYPYSKAIFKSVTGYSYGLKNGPNKYFDSTGKLIYSGYYYHGLAAGPLAYYDNQGNPERFFFLSLDNHTILNIDYKHWQGVASIVRDCVNFTSNIQEKDSKEQLSIFLYLIQPPKFLFEYSILSKSINSDQEYKNIYTIKGQEKPFIELDLPLLPVDEQYFIGLSIYDSLLDKRSQVYINVQ